MAGKGDNTAKRTDFKKYWKNYPTKWKRKKGKKKVDESSHIAQ